jgi:hypothetical protein
LKTPLHLFVTLVIAGCGGRTDLGAPTGDGPVASSDDGKDGGKTDGSGDGGAAASTICHVTAPTLLYSGGEEITAVAVDDTSVYWTDFVNRTVQAADGAGGLRLVGTGNGPHGITAASGDVYWTDFSSGEIAHVVGQGAADVVAHNQLGASDVAVIGADVYWTTYDGDTVARLHGSTTPEILVQGGAAYTSITTDGQLVFWAGQVDITSGDIHSYDPATETITSLVEGLAGAPWSVATDGTNVYYIVFSADQTTIASIPIGGGPPVALATVSIDGAACPGGGCQGHVATDGRFVYFTSDVSDGVVSKVPVTGGTPVVIADHQPQPYGIAVDTTCVYWGNFANGTVMMAPK